MKIIGITGSFGTGKTYVASIFNALGGRVIDADRIAHDAIKKGTPEYKKIVNIFGSGILDKKGNIVRAALAGKVFENKRDLKRINRIVHPRVIKTIKERIRRSGKDDIVIIDAPLLIEANLARLVDTLVVVKAGTGDQIKRCVKKFCINKEDVLKRINSQMSIKRKMELADFVIDNSGAKSQTRKQVRNVWRKIVWK